MSVPSFFCQLPCHGITKASETAGGHKFVVDEEGTTVLLRLKKVLAMLDT